MRRSGGGIRQAFRHGFGGNGPDRLTSRNYGLGETSGACKEEPIIVEDPQPKSSSSAQPCLPCVPPLPPTCQFTFAPLCSYVPPRQGLLLAHRRQCPLSRICWPPPLPLEGVMGGSRPLCPCPWRSLFISQFTPQHLSLC